MLVLGQCRNVDACGHAIVYGGDMISQESVSDSEFEQRIRRALKTKPISNEEIERRSKEARKRR